MQTFSCWSLRSEFSTQALIIFHGKIVKGSLFKVYQIISAFYLIDLNKTQSQEYTNKFAESIEYKR